MVPVLTAFVLSVEFSENDPIIKIPGVPEGRVKAVTYDLPVDAYLDVKVIGHDREPVNPKITPTFTTLDGKRFPLEPRGVPDSPVVVRYGMYRGVKKATVLVFEITKEGGKYYRNRRVTLNVSRRYGPPSPASLPGTDSLDLLILTTDYLKPAFDTLAEFKNLTGIRTAVFTVDEALTFPGRTPAERIRNFVRYFYERWGIRFLLIGGDRFQVPSPILQLPSAWPYDYGDVMQSDAYYGSLDGDWNANGNWNFGEFSDSLDLWVDVAVGRMPASSLDEAMEMVRRVIYYETHYNYPFPPNVQLFASRYLVDNDACSTVGNMAAYLPPGLDQDTLCEMDMPMRDVTMDEFVDSVSNSTFVMAFSHSNYRTFIVNIDTVTVPFLAQDVVRLRTDSTPVFWMHMGCLVNSPHTNSINALIYKAGKSIASYGPSKESAPGAAVSMVATAFRSAYLDTSGFFAGMVDLYAKHFAASMGHYFTYVYEGLSYNLIGDPSLRLYRTVPSSTTPTVTLAGDTLYVSGAPSGAIVSVLQDGKVIGRWITDGSGNLSARLRGASPGDVKVGVYAEGYLPFITTLPFGPSSPSLRISYPDTVRSGDSLHISGKVYAGSSSIDSVWVVFYGPPPLLSDSVYLGAVGAGDSASFNLNVAATPFKGDVRLEGYVSVKCTACDGVGDSVYVMGYGPSLSFVGARYSGDTLRLILLNSGKARSTSVSAIFTGGDVTPVSIVSPPEVPPNATDSVVVLLPSALSPGDGLGFRITDREGDTIGVALIFPTSLPSAPVLQTEPGNGFVRLLWDGDYDGTLVEVDTGGGWRVLSVLPAEWNTVEDGYEGWKVRCYRVSPISGGFLGPPSAPVCNRPNPPLRFSRKVLFGGYRSHLLAADLLPSPGYELIVPSVYNYVSVFSSSGDLLWRYSVDTLPDLTEISAPPAVGDVDGDGEYEVIFGVSGDNPSLIALDKTGSPEWRRTLPAVPTGPVVLGLFTGTPYPSVAVKVGDRVLFYDGTGNLINSCGPYVWADEYMSAADLYGDGRWELVVRGSSSGNVTVFLNADCEDTTVTLPYPTYVGSRIYDSDGDGRWDVLLNASNGVYIFDPSDWSLDSVSFPVPPEPDVTMSLEWDGTPGWEYARINMYDLVVEDGNGSVLLSHHDDIHPRGRRFVAGDVDGDGREEVFFSSGRSVLWGKTHYGDLLGFPINLGHGDRFREEVVQGGAVVYDLDGDGRVELCAHTSGHYLYCWNLGPSSRLSWPMVRGNRWNSGFGSLEMPDTQIVGVYTDEIPKRDVRITLSGRKLTIEGWTHGTVGVKIYTVAGRMVLGRKVAAEGRFNVSLSLNDLPVGVYFLSVAIGETRKEVKVILR